MLNSQTRCYRIEVPQGQAELRLINQAGLFNAISVQVSLQADSGSANMVKWSKNLNNNDLNISIFVLNSLDPSNSLDQYNGIVDVWIGINDVDINTINLNPTVLDIENF